MCKGSFYLKSSGATNCLNIVLSIKTTQLATKEYQMQRSVITYYTRNNLTEDERTNVNSVRNMFIRRRKTSLEDSFINVLHQETES